MPKTKLVMVESETPCKDCGLKVFQHTLEKCWMDPLTRPHNGLCCDCYDENYWGMPASQRTRQRPDTDTVGTH